MNLLSVRSNRVRQPVFPAGQRLCIAVSRQRSAPGRESPGPTGAHTRLPRQERICLLLLALGVGLYLCFFCSLVFRRYTRFAVLDFDLGIFDQATWLISRGYSPFITIRGTHLLADHFSPVLYLVAPLYWLWDSPKALLLAQTAVLAAGALPLYALARRQLASAPAALLLALVYLLYPPMQWSNMYEFHPETFATPVLLGAFYALHRAHWKTYYTLLILATFTKETVGLAVAAVGFYALFIDRRVGIRTILLGILAMGVAMETVRLFNHGVSSPYIALYAPLGSTPGAILAHLARHPFAVAATLETNTTLNYLRDLLLPLCFLPLLAPEVLLLTAPLLLLNLLSNRDTMHDMHFQYTALITPFLLIASLRALQICVRYTSAGVMWTLLLCQIACLPWAVSKSPMGPEYASSLITEAPLTRVREMQRVIDLIPSRASVTATSNLSPHLAHRREIYTFPNPFTQFCWGSTIQALHQENGEDITPWTHAGIAGQISASHVDYIALESQPTASVPAYPDFALIALSSATYGVIAAGHDVILLRRGADHAAGIRLLEQALRMPARTIPTLSHALKAWVGSRDAPMMGASRRKR